MDKFNNKYRIPSAQFHDHIIRTDKSYKTISEYIINNPAKWADDKFYNE